VIKRQANDNQEKNVWHGNSDENGHPSYRQRSGQPEIVKLIELFLYSPDIRVGG
jgi:hypothetical protein